MDLHAAHDPLRGRQDGRFFHGYYDGDCYLPLYIFCGRHLLAAKLRPANIDAAAGAPEEVIRITRQVRQRWLRTRILLHTDSGFCWNGLVDGHENNRADQVFGLARTPRSARTISKEQEQAEQPSLVSGRDERVVKDFIWTRRTRWSRKRRVISEAELTGGEANPRLVVTCVKHREYGTRVLYEKTSCAREKMQNRIKECQADLFADRTSTAKMVSCQLWFYSMAHVLISALRRIALPDTQVTNASCETIRLKILKVGARVLVSFRRILFAKTSSHPWAEEWGEARRRFCLA